MQDAILIISVLGIFMIGYVLMGRMDNFLIENRKTLEHENERTEPSCMMLPQDMPDEELIEEIHTFRRRHENMRIMLYDSAAVCAGRETKQCFERKK